ncbi:hypothetical protein MTsN2n6_33650 [Vibrio fortis]
MTIPELIKMLKYQVSLSDYRYVEFSLTVLKVMVSVNEYHQETGDHQP